MGLGSTTKKIQLLAERAEQMVKQVGELRDQIADLRDTVDETGQQVDDIAKQNERQWVVMQALAEEQGIEVDVLLAEASIETVEPPEDEAEESDEAPDDSP